MTLRLFLWLRICTERELPRELLFLVSIYQLLSAARNEPLMTFETFSKGFQTTAKSVFWSNFMQSVVDFLKSVTLENSWLVYGSSIDAGAITRRDCST
jgi:hypothetical protein